MKKFKDFTKKDCCINCEAFCWWDGDYCCTMKMKIHQYGYGNENGGYFANPYMNRDIDNTMQLGKNCEDYRKWGTYMYVPNCPNEHLEEYKRFKEWDKLCYQLEQHVSDPSDVYEKYIKPIFYPNIEEFINNKK